MEFKKGLTSCYGSWILTNSDPEKNDTAAEYIYSARYNSECLFGAGLSRLSELWDSDQEIEIMEEQVSHSPDRSEESRTNILSARVSIVG